MGACGVCLAFDFAGALRAFAFEDVGFEDFDFVDFALERFFFDLVFVPGLRALDFFEAFLIEVFFATITLLLTELLSLQG